MTVQPETPRRAWRSRRRGLLDRFDDALCAAAGLPYDEQPEPTLTFSDWTERTPSIGTPPSPQSWPEQLPGHNID